jgi:putative transposase
MRGTDQGAQFTNGDWLNVLREAGVQISMDGKGRWIDNVFIELLWRTVKYEEVYSHAYRDGREARQRLSAYFEFYNARRIHQALDYRTPDEVYCNDPAESAQLTRLMQMPPPVSSCPVPDVAGGCCRSRSNRR